MGTGEGQSLPVPNNKSMKYEESLSKIIQCETISKLGQSDLSKFSNAHEVYKELFPNIFKKAEYENINGCMLLKWTGLNHDKPVLFMNHTDVVEANGEWKYPPFSGAIAEGKVWGRGTQDTKEGLWAMLTAADELAAEGFVPNQDIYFESSCNEEISGEGADYISKLLEEKGIEFDFIIDEGGKIFADSKLEAPDSNSRQYIANVGLSEKGVSELEFVARGEGGHASRPPKNTPLVRLGRFMAAVEDNIDEIFPAAIVKETGEEEKTTIAFTMAEGSNGRNVIPTKASVICSLRSSHHQGVDESINKITEFAKKFDIEVNVLFRGMDAPISPWDENTDVCKLIQDAVKTQYPNTEFKPYIMTGATDALYFTRICDRVYRFSPFVITKEQEATIHSVNENIDISSLAPAVAIFHEIYKNI